MKKILIVEDEQILREDIRDILGYENFEVIEAENGVRGVEMARLHLPDLIICDIMMPKLDGYGVLIELQSSAATAHIPFIFLTAKTGRADMRRGMELGADDYLIKPFTQPELIAAIQVRLAKYEQAKQDHEQKMEQLRSSVIRALPHELRTPLTGIIGYARMLMEEPSIDASQVVQMATGIDKSARRLHHLIENYLLYAQVELIATDANRLAVAREQHIAEADMIIQDIATGKAKEHKREADLTCACQAQTVVKISLESLEKIALELIDNAFKFSVAGTSVKVETRQTADAFQLIVTNQGRGMSPEQIQQIGAYLQFERRFYEQTGLGLGLTLAKRLTELHLGTLSIESQPDQQTTLTVSLPLG